MNIYDVAREAGVSLATVSRVINGSDNVKGNTRTRVELVIERLQFKPNENAQKLGRAKRMEVT